VYRGEAVEAQCHSLQVRFALSVVTLHKERHLGGSGLDHSKRGIVVARGPVGVPDSRPDEALEKSEVVGRGAGARGQQYAIGDIAGSAAAGAGIHCCGLLLGQNPPPRLETAGQGNVEMGSAVVWMSLIGVEMLRRNVGAGIAV